MKFCHNYRTLVVEYCQWQIQDQIQTALNCELNRPFTFSNNAIDILELNFSFITYRSCRHLDGKHTIFGKLVGGLETLNEMEKIEVDNKDRPIEDIFVEKAHIFVDPFQEADEQLMKERADEIEKQQKAVADEKKRKERAQPLKVFRSGVGKYLNTTATKPTTSSDQTATSTSDSAVKKKKPNSSYGFGNFGSW